MTPKKSWYCLAIAAPLALIAGAARATDNSPVPFTPPDCRALYTYNKTNNWIWVTIYDTAKVTHMDWGWVAPHTDRRWTAGGAPPPMNTYYCTIFYFARAEVKAGGPADTPNIFDTTVRMYPVATGSGSNRACLETKDGKSFYWDYSDSCIGIDTATITNTGPAGMAASPAAVRDALPPPLVPKPFPQHAVVKLSDVSAQAPFGPQSKVYRVRILADGQMQPQIFGTLGKWSTMTPAIIKLTDNDGGFRVLRAGNGTVSWTYGDRTYSAMVTSH